MSVAATPYELVLQGYLHKQVRALACAVSIDSASF